jgi:hypothetical protein
MQITDLGARPSVTLQNRSDLLQLDEVVDSLWNVRLAVGTPAPKVDEDVRRFLLLMAWSVLVDDVPVRAFSFARERTHQPALLPPRPSSRLRSSTSALVTRALTVVSCSTARWRTRL